MARFRAVLFVPGMAGKEITAGTAFAMAGACTLEGLHMMIRGCCERQVCTSRASSGTSDLKLVSLIYHVLSTCQLWGSQYDQDVSGGERHALAIWPCAIAQCIGAVRSGRRGAQCRGAGRRSRVDSSSETFSC